MNKIKKIQEKAKCCSCEESLADGMQMLALPFRAKWNHPTWRTNAIKGKLAAAIVCNKCIVEKKQPKFVIEWDNKTLDITYHPVEELEDISEIIGKKFKKKGVKHGR